MKRFGELAGVEIGKILRRKRLEGEARTASLDADPTGISTLVEFELGAIWQLAHDVIEHVGGDRHRALLGDFG